jgi:hypothetical protein
MIKRLIQRIGNKELKNLAFEIHEKGISEYNKLLKELEKRFSTFKKEK